MNKLLLLLASRPKWETVFLCLALTTFLGIIDYLTGDFSLTIFYILPVFIATWIVHRWVGFAFCLVSGAAIILAQIFPDFRLAKSSSTFVWNTSMEVCFLVIMNLMFSQLKKELELEKSLARTDHLTGALNRRSFIELAAYEISQSQRHMSPLTITYIDLDNFKTVNDSLGHHVGDTLLSTVVKILQESIRNTDQLARLGGDEFCVLFPETEANAANALLTKLQARLVDAMKVKGWPVTFSMGAITYITPPASVESMLKEADARMYEVKQNGKNMISHAIIEARFSA